MEPPLTPTVPEAASPQPAPGTDALPKTYDLTGTETRWQAAWEQAMVRFQRLQGKNVLCLPGTDHASIAVLQLEPMAVRG
jgi:valyl-tRNA synthetase